MKQTTTISDSEVIVSGDDGSVRRYLYAGTASAPGTEAPAVPAPPAGEVYPSVTELGAKVANPPYIPWAGEKYPFTQGKDNVFKTRLKVPQGAKAVQLQVYKHGDNSQTWNHVLQVAASSQSSPVALPPQVDPMILVAVGEMFPGAHALANVGDEIELTASLTDMPAGVGGQFRLFVNPNARP